MILKQTFLRTKNQAHRVSQAYHKIDNVLNINIFITASPLTSLI